MAQFALDLGEFDPNVHFYQLVDRLKEEGASVVEERPLSNVIIVSASEDIRHRIEEIAAQARGE